MNKKMEPWARALLLSLYFCLSLLLLKQWELTTDDGDALTLAGQSSLFFQGLPSSTGLVRGPAVYYIYALLLRSFRSLWLLQAGILLLQLAAHSLLIQILKNLGRTALGYASSLLFFFSPTFLVIYAGKFWEPALLPFASIAALFCLLKFDQTRRPSFFAGALMALLLATSAHPSSLAFLPIAGFLFWRRREAVSLHWRLTLGALTAILLFPYLSWLSAPRADAIRLSLARLPAPLYHLAAMLENAYAAERIGLPPVWTGIWIPSFLLLLVFFYRVAKGRSLNWMLGAWLGVPLLLLCLASLFFPQFPFQWNLILFPLVWVAILDAAMERSRALAAVAFALFLGLALFGSFRQIQFLRESGGIGMHGASYGTKLAVLEKIYRKSTHPSVVMVAYPFRGLWWYHSGGWQFLQRRVRERFPTNPYSPERFFYIYEPSGPDEEAIRARLEKEKGLSSWQEKSVTVFEGKTYLDGVGIFLE